MHQYACKIKQRQSLLMTTRTASPLRRSNCKSSFYFPYFPICRSKTRRGPSERSRGVGSRQIIMPLPLVLRTNDHHADTYDTRFRRRKLRLRDYHHYGIIAHLERHGAGRRVTPQNGPITGAFGSTAFQGVFKEEGQIFVDIVC